MVRRNRAAIIAILALVTMSGLSEAQIFTLPSFDGISVFTRAERFSPDSSWDIDAGPPIRWNEFPATGWGFETLYQITPDDKAVWSADLALGYDYVSLRGRMGAAHEYELVGSIQTIPSFAFYSNWSRNSTGVYVGLGSGIVSLKNVKLYDQQRRIYSIEGTTWDLSASAGGMWKVLERNQRRPEVLLFAEISYELRDFAGISYTLPSNIDPAAALPAGLPTTITANGPAVHFGLQIKFVPKPKPPCATASRVGSSPTARPIPSPRAPAERCFSPACG